MLSAHKQKIIHRLFLGAVIIVGILSLIPPIKPVGALVLRGLIFLNLATITATEKSWKSWAWNSIKMVAVIIGMVGLILAMLPLSAAAFGIDIFMQLKEIRDAYKEGNAKAFLIHTAFLIVDILALAAIVTGGWELAAGAAGVAAMTFMGIACVAWMQVKNVGDFFEGLAYFILAGLSIATALQATPKRHYNKPHSEITNRSDQEITVFDNNGKTLAIIPPGEHQSIAPIPNAFTVRVSITGENAINDITFTNHGPSYTAILPGPATDIPLLPLPAPAYVSSSILEKDNDAPSCEEFCRNAAMANYVYGF